MNDCKLFINESVPKILFHFLVNTKTLTKRQLYSVWTYDEKNYGKNEQSYETTISIYSPTLLRVTH